MFWFALVPALVVLWMVGQHWLPWGRAMAGDVVHVERLTLLGRLRGFGRAASVGLGLVIVGHWLGWVPLPVALALALLLLLIPAVPFSYTLTTLGISRGRSGFRNWTEFGGVTRQTGAIRLGGVAGRRGMTVWLGGDRDDDAFVLLVRQLLRGSYQGFAGTGPGAVEPPPVWTGPGGLPGAMAS